MQVHSPFSKRTVSTLEITEIAVLRVHTGGGTPKVEYPVLFAISSSSIDSPVTHARLACSLLYTLAICLTHALNIWEALEKRCLKKIYLAEIFTDYKLV